MPKRNTRNIGGLKLGAEDIQWLRLIEIRSETVVPPYNQSRLIALGLAEKRDGKLVPTEHGIKTLSN